MSAPVKRAPKKAPAKRSPRAARPAPVEPSTPTAPADESTITDEDLAAIAADGGPPEDTGGVAKDGTVHPVMVGKAGRTPVEMADVFEVDGHMWQVPARPSPALMIQYQMDLVEFGREEATARLLTTYLGRPALKALAASPDVTEQDVTKVFDILHHYIFGRDATTKRQEASDPS